MKKQHVSERPLRLQLPPPRMLGGFLGCLLCLGIIFASNCSWFVLDSAAAARTPPGIAQNQSPNQVQHQLQHQAINWDDLRPPTVTDFVNPYADLSSRQLLDLAKLSKIEETSNELKQDLDQKEGQRLHQRLIDEGLDVEELLSQVERVTNHYTQQATDTNSDIYGQPIKLLGYVLPLSQSGSYVTDFLLVPFIGACVHVPPPHPNQMIYVEPPQAIDNPGLFAQVWLEGTIYPQSSSHEFFRVDGEQQVDVSYAMEITAIVPYTSPTNTVSENILPEGIAPGHAIPSHSIAGNPFFKWPSALLTIPGDDYNNYPLWQRIQVQLSTVFTRTMTQIKTQGAWQTLPLGLLIAFSYGVLHTLGPGHGKAVIVSYFIGKDGSWQRGVVMGIRIAIFHVISAIAIVIFAHVVLEQTIGHSAASYRIIRLLSYAAIATIGGWMLRQSIYSPQHQQPMRSDSLRDAQSLPQPLPQSLLQIAAQPLPQATAQTADQRTKWRSPNDILMYPSLKEQILTKQVPRQARQARRTITSVGGLCSCLSCGDQGNSGNWLSVAVGAVPCSGALLVLLYGLGNNMLWPSVLMVLAISIGMAITLSSIGVMAIWGQSRTRQHPCFNPQRQRLWNRWGPILGASSVCLMGLFMFGFTLMSAIANLAP